jgi:hypothetical protein
MSTGLIDGGSASSSPARAISADAIGPPTCAWRALSSSNVSKMAYEVSSILTAY